jgi:hypothetical protein
VAFPLALLAAACGGDGGNHAAPTPSPTPPVLGEEDDAFDLDLATRLGALCVQSYRMLTDFQSGTSIRDVQDLEDDHAMCNYFATLCAQTGGPPSCYAMADGADGCNPG